MRRWAYVMVCMLILYGAEAAPGLQATNLLIFVAGFFLVESDL